MIDFEQQAQEDLYARVATYLRQAFGDLAEPTDEDPAFIVELGSVRLLVTVHANGPEKASITVINRLGDGLPITSELATYLLHKSYQLPFGRLSLNDDDQIVFAEIVFGEGVTKENLSILLRIMASYSDEIEDELTMQFR